MELACDGIITDLAYSPDRWGQITLTSMIMIYASNYYEVGHVKIIFKLSTV